MAIHADFCRRDAGERGRLHRGVTIATVDSIIPDVVLVAERYGLGAGDACLRDIGGTIDYPEQHRQNDHENNAAKNGDLREGVSARMEYLGHQPMPIRPSESCIGVVP